VIKRRMQRGKQKSVRHFSETLKRNGGGAKGVPGESSVGVKKRWKKVGETFVVGGGRLGGWDSDL